MFAFITSFILKCTLSVKYSFLIGGEGTVFVGRGWYKRAMQVPRNTMINEKCVEIAYIGQFKCKYNKVCETKLHIQFISF